MKNKFYWSYVEYQEMWVESQSTVEECILEAKAYSGTEYDEFDSVFVGEVEYYSPSICAESIIDNILDQAYEECGDSAEGYLQVSDAQFDTLGEKLQNVLNEWLVEIDEVDKIGKIINIKQYEL